jgi:hypothetical protein
MPSPTRIEDRNGRLFGKDRTVPCDVTLNYQQNHLMLVAIGDMAQPPPDGSYTLTVGSEELGAWRYWCRQNGAWTPE